MTATGFPPKGSDSVGLEWGLLGGLDAQPHLGTLGLVEEYDLDVEDWNLALALLPLPGARCSNL